MTLQDLISEISKLDPELEINCSENRPVISFDYEISKKSEEEEFEDDHHLVEMSYIDSEDDCLN